MTKLERFDKIKEAKGDKYMDWYYITPHLISGYIPVMAALVLYFLVLHMAGKKQNIGHAILSFVFCFYLVAVFVMTGICVKSTFSPNIVYIPFLDMIRGPVDTVLNILLFVPLGFFIPFMYKKFYSISKIVLAGFLISLSIEIVQMFGYGATDINDLITNTAGACLGFGIFKLLYRVIPKSWMKHIQVDGSQCYYELMFFWIGSLLVMLTVQIQIFHSFFSSGRAGSEIQEWK